MRLRDHLGATDASCMTRRIVRCATFLPILGVALLQTSPGGVTAATADPPPARDEGTPAHPTEHVAIPAGIEAFVAGDMVVHWIDDAAEPAPELRPAPGVAVELTIGSERGDDAPSADHGLHEAARADDRTEPADHHAAASGGYALFSTTARWLPDGYTIRLTGADARIEQYRDEITAAARTASATTGVPIRIAPGLGGPVDPGRGEIAVAIGTGPCGSGSVGCGGPALTTREVVAGRVWVHPTGLDISAGQRSNLAAHELGHALGLQHFDGSWTDGRQVMYPVITGTTSYRAGDSAGLRHVAGAADHPAGTVTSRTYAAGRAHVAGTVASGSRIRLSSGSTVAEVPVAGGRFSGSLPLPAGSHQVCATSLDPAPGFRWELGCGPVEAPGTPFGHLDDLQGSAATLRVSGWAIDPQTAGTVRVQITRNGAVVATVDAGGERSDLGDTAQHYGTAHGFDAGITPDPGRNRICVLIIGVGAGGDAGAGCAEIDHEVASVDAPGSVPVVPERLPAAPPVPLGGTAATALAVVDDVVQDLAGTRTAPALLGVVSDIAGG